MFALADPERVRELLEEAGFVEPVVEPVALKRDEAGVGTYLEETLDLSRPFAEVRDRLTREQWEEVSARVRSLAEPFATGEGGLRFPASSLAASASA